MLFLGSRGITLEIRHRSLLCKVCGDKSEDTAFLFDHYFFCISSRHGERLAQDTNYHRTSTSGCWNGKHQTISDNMVEVIP